MRRNHLLALLEQIEESEYSVFILETNGILAERDYVKAITRFEKPHVRVSLKAGTPAAFTRKTGARPESFELPFRAIRNLIDYGVSFHVAAMSADPRIMRERERESMIKRLAEIDPVLVRNLEEEIVDPYRTTLARLGHAGLELEWPLKEIHPPIRPPKRGEFLKPRWGRYSHSRARNGDDS